MTRAQFRRFGEGQPITWHESVSPATHGWAGDRIDQCWMRFEEGKRFHTDGKTYFIIDGCARELLGEAESNLFSNDLNVHSLDDDYLRQNDWHVYLGVASDTQLM